MKFSWTLVAAFALFALTKVAAVEKYTSAFVESFENLHKGPPPLPLKYTSENATKWIIQKRDHFDDKNTGTWKMRYMVNDNNFKKGGPIFIHLGGEWTITQARIMYGILPDLAQANGGILFQTEHRYYGHSKPTRNFSVKNLQKYLHVKQALADVAHFIRYQREIDPRLTNSKVIISGGSYSASMVVWFSKLYPELIVGGWASSAPLLAKVDFEEYKEVMGEAIRELGSQECYERIENGIAELEALFENNRSAEVKAMLQLCNPFNATNELDLWTLFSTVSNIFAGIIQYQKEGNIPEVCQRLMYFPDDLTAIATFVLDYISSGAGCVDASYQSSVDYFQSTLYSRSASRLWFFQTCNEYGWYQSSASKQQPFGTKFPAALYLSLCRDAFGSQYTDEHIHHLVAETNKDFGGLSPQVKNVYMTHGALDPWSAIGHNETHGASVISQASHCADFGSISERDSDEMRASKQRLFALVKEWLD